jgi:hypothetical protein
MADNKALRPGLRIEAKAQAVEVAIASVKILNEGIAHTQSIRRLALKAAFEVSMLEGGMKPCQQLPRRPQELLETCSVTSLKPLERHEQPTYDQVTKEHQKQQTS